MSSVFLANFILSLFGLGILLTFPRSSLAADTAPPDPVKDLQAASSTDKTLTLTWTAPGDDGMSGTVSQYDLRMDTMAINAGEALYAPVVGGEPQPLPGGTEQSMTVKELTPSTTYWFILKSQDRVGNVSAWSNVASGATALDTTPPAFERIKVVDITGEGARVTWRSNEASTSEVRYGPDETYGLFATSNSLVVEHSLPLGGLSPDTLYHYQLRSSDQYGNSAATVNMTFETQATSTQVSAPLVSPSAATEIKGKVEAKEQPAIVFTPKTLDLKSKGKWITAVLRLPKGERVGMVFEDLKLNSKVKPAMDFNQRKTQNVLTRYGTLWLKFRRSEVHGLVPPEVSTFTLTLSGKAGNGEFSVDQNLKVVNNITQAEWDRREEAKRQQFEANKQKRISALEKLIAEVRKKLEELEKKLLEVQNEVYSGTL